MKILRALPILLVPMAVAAGLSCADIAAPDREDDAYEWRLIVPTVAGTPDTLSFHWPRARLPVRIWVEDSLNQISHVQSGIAQWEAAFLYGEFAAVVVSDSNTADVVVRVGSVFKGGFSITRLESALAPECEGGTDFDLPDGSSELRPPIRVFVNPRFDPASPGVPECMALTTTHELGHAIGILAHSPEPTDIMFGDPVVPTLSSRDRRTAEVAYHTEPTLTIAPR
jgi:predicted Zn-dependent protease